MRARSVALALVALLLSVGASAASVETTTAATDAPTYGSHFVTRAAIADANGHPTAVFAAEDPDGDVVFLVYLSGNRLYATDGVLDGISHPPKVLPTAVGTGWFRLDATLHGAQYSLTLDGEDTITARTSKYATLASIVSDPRPLFSEDYEHVEWARPRADLSDGATDTTFTVSFAESGWSTSVTGRGAINLMPDSLGRQSKGMAEVLGPEPFGVAFLHAPLASFAGGYAAEASIHKAGTLPPLQQAVLAGIVGQLDHPTMVWAVETELRLGLPGTWGLALVTPDGRLSIGPTWGSGGWVDVRVRVDESADSIQVWIDSDLAASVQGSGIVPSAHLAAGDVRAEAGPTTTAYAFYDELALYKEASA